VPTGRISEKDFFGRTFIRIPGGSQVAGYFNTISSIRKLLRDHQFVKSVSGYYFNVAGNLDTVRLSYFCTDKMSVPIVIDSYLTSNGLLKTNEELPHEARVSEGYKGEELRFRKFLFLYSLIGLDLLNYDLEYSRRLVGHYRLDISTQRISSNPTFEPAFEKHSETFRKLSSSAKDQLWKDLDYWHSEWEDWAHMLVNMLLPGDWIYSEADWVKNLFRYPSGPIIGNVRDELLSGIALNIPHGWRP